MYCIDHNLMSFIFSDTTSAKVGSQLRHRDCEIPTQSLGEFSKDKTDVSVETSLSSRIQR